MPAYYLIGAGVVGAISIYFARESARKPLPGSPPSVADEQEAKDLVSSGS
jgi:MHS family proline/betaine transporter-like MFS transporter